MLIKAPKATGTFGVTRACANSSACSNHRTGVRYFAVLVTNPIRLEDSLSQTGSGSGNTKDTLHQSIWSNE
jgi:hypothetical protein